MKMTAFFRFQTARFGFLIGSCPVTAISSSMTSNKEMVFFHRETYCSRRCLCVLIKEDCSEHRSSTSQERQWAISLRRLETEWHVCESEQSWTFFINCKQICVCSPTTQPTGILCFYELLWRRVENHKQSIKLIKNDITYKERGCATLWWIVGSDCAGPSFFFLNKVAVGTHLLDVIGKAFLRDPWEDIGAARLCWAPRGGGHVNRTWLRLRVPLMWLARVLSAGFRATTGRSSEAEGSSQRDAGCPLSLSRVCGAACISCGWSNEPVMSVAFRKKHG